jgi:hypothetical protein
MTPAETMDAGRGGRRILSLGRDGGFFLRRLLGRLGLRAAL